MGNQFKTAILLAVMTAFILWVGQMIGGRQGMMLALLVAAGMNFFSYWYSDKIVLRMYRAREASGADAPQLYDVVRSLTRRAGLPMSKIFVIPQEAPNAFATGRNPEHAVVAVTEGLLRMMDREELMGVLGHELGHVKNRDILIGSIAATLAGAVMMLASLARWSAIFGIGGSDDEGGMGTIGLIAMSIIAPIAAMVIQMAISRSREFQADASGASFSGNPDSLARALEKLGTYNQRIPMPASPSTAQMFIVNPLSGKNFRNLFSTHPPIEERIARLRGIRPPASGPSAPVTGPEARHHPGSLEDAGREFWDRLS